MGPNPIQSSYKKRKFRHREKNQGCGHKEERPCEDTVRGQPSVNQGEKFRRNQICWHLHLGPLAPRTVRKLLFVLSATQLLYFAMVALEYQYTDLLIISQMSVNYHLFISSFWDKPWKLKPDPTHCEKSFAWLLLRTSQQVTTMLYAKWLYHPCHDWLGLTQTQSDRSVIYEWPGIRVLLKGVLWT